MNPPEGKSLHCSWGNNGMKCIKCGQRVEPEALRTFDAELRGRRVSVRLRVPWCAPCNRPVILGQKVRAYHRVVSDAYRREVGLLTTGEIDGFRRSLNMTWPEFADYLFIGIATLKRWNRGEIQTQALDRLVRLRADPSFLERAASELHERLTKATFSCVARRGPQLEWIDLPSYDVEPVSVARTAGNSGAWRDQVRAELSLAA